MKNNLYILYDHYWPNGDDGGAENYPVAICLAENLDRAKWKFKLMGHRTMIESNFVKIEEILPFDNGGYMFQIPEYLIP